MHDVFLAFSANKLEQLADRIDLCLTTLTEEQIWWRGADAQNAVGNLVLHLCGNVRQWIISSIGGAADVRKRDEEFAARGGVPTDTLRENLRTTVQEAVSVLRGLPHERLLERIEVQKYEVTALEAIYHVVEHFAQHEGQIVYATKLFTSKDLGFYKHLTATAHSEKTP